MCVPSIGRTVPDATTRMRGHPRCVPCNSSKTPELAAGLGWTGRSLIADECGSPMPAVLESDGLSAKPRRRFAGISSLACDAGSISRGSRCRGRQRVLTLGYLTIKAVPRGRNVLLDRKLRGIDNEGNGLLGIDIASTTSMFPLARRPNDDDGRSGGVSHTLSAAVAARGGSPLHHLSIRRKARR